MSTALTKRDSKGRFAPGTRGGPGRFSRPKEKLYLAVMMTECTLGDWKEITRRAVEDAKAGNKDARKWLSDYILGPASQVIAAIATTQHDSASDASITRMAAIIGQLARVDPGE